MRFEPTGINLLGEDHTKVSLDKVLPVVGSTSFIYEPFAADTLADNLNPVGRVFYAASTLVCTPSSLDQEVGLGLGAQAGEKRLAEVCREAGFTSVRRAAETPTNMVLEVTG
jgi:hypothetical protein